MRYQFFCEGCLSETEVDLSLAEFERYEQGDRIECLSCGFPMRHVICIPALSSERVTNGF